MNIAIVGAGLAGLSAAYRLQQRGHEVTVYEASDQVGGRAQLLNRPGTDDWADVGSQYYHSNYRFGMALIKDLGLKDQLKVIKGNTRFFTSDGKSFCVTPRWPYMKSGGLWNNLRMATHLLALITRHRINVFGLSPSTSLDNTSALDNSPTPFVKDYIARMLILIGGLSEPALHNVSALQKLRLIRIILMTDYVTLHGGTATLHHALAQQVNVRLNTKIRSISLDQHDNVKGIIAEDNRTINADHIIIATQAPHAATLVPTTWTHEKAFLSNINMPPALIVSLYLNCELEKDVWTYMTPIENEGLVTFVVDAQQKSPANTPSGKATLQAWILHPQASDIIEKDDNSIVNAVLEDLSGYLPNLASQLEDSHITRHTHAVPQSPVGHNQQAIDFFDAVDQRQSISFCGDYFTGGYMECALWSVDRMLQRLE